MKKPVTNQIDIEGNKLLLSKHRLSFVCHTLRSSLLMVTSAFLLGACSNSISDAGQRHKLRVDQWQELARYAADEFDTSAVTITAKLANTQEGMRLQDIRLERLPVGRDKISLLSPSFIDATVCGDDCFRLSALSVNNAMPDSHLTQLYTQVEGELFAFYGDLTNLAKKLSLLRLEGRLKLQAYLSYLIEKKASFSQLQGVTDFLQGAFSVEDYITFFQQGTNSESIFLANNGHAWESEAWRSGNAELTQVQTVSNDKARSNQKVEEKQTPDEALITQLNLAQTFDQNKAVTSFKYNQKKRLDVGMTVCTFSGNFFGTIKQIDGSSLLVELQGQARILKDGLRMQVTDGYLFSAPSNLLFVKVTDSKELPSSELAFCNITPTL